MKQLLLAALLVLTAAAARADTVTFNFGFIIPSTGSTNWAPKVDDWVVKLDTGAAGIYLPNVFQDFNDFPQGVSASTGSFTAISTFSVVSSSGIKVVNGSVVVPGGVVGPLYGIAAVANSVGGGGSVDASSAVFTSVSSNSVVLSSGILVLAGGVTAPWIYAQGMTLGGSSFYMNGTMVVPALSEITWPSGAYLDSDYSGDITLNTTSLQINGPTLLNAGLTAQGIAAAGVVSAAGGVTGSSASFTGGVTASSATLTATGGSQYSLQTSSGILVQGGTLTNNGGGGEVVKYGVVAASATFTATGASYSIITSSGISIGGNVVSPSSGSFGGLFAKTAQISSQTNGCAQFDASGNLTSVGSSCSAGGGVAAGSTTTWSGSNTFAGLGVTTTTVQGNFTATGPVHISTGFNITFPASLGFSMGQTSFNSASIVTGSTGTFTPQTSTVTCHVMASIASSIQSGIYALSIGVDGSFGGITGTSSSVGLVTCQSGTGTESCNDSFTIEFQVTAGVSHSFFLGAASFSGTGTFPQSTGIAQFGCRDSTYR